MKKEMITWIIGDVCGDGHGKYDTINIVVNFNGDGTAVERLENAEKTIVEKLGINIDEWFKEYLDNIIPKEEVEKLKKLGIEPRHESSKNEDGTITVSCPIDYFEIWKQLIEIADKDIKIELHELPDFYSVCDCYGIFQE
jgi:hypothetical protein